MKTLKKFGTFILLCFVAILLRQFNTISIHHLNFDTSTFIIFVIIGFNFKKIHQWLSNTNNTPVNNQDKYPILVNKTNTELRSQIVELNKQIDALKKDKQILRDAASSNFQFLADKTQLNQKYLELIKFISDIVLTSSDGGHLWCELRDKPGAVEWLNKLKETMKTKN